MFVYCYSTIHIQISYYRPFCELKRLIHTYIVRKGKNKQYGTEQGRLISSAIQQQQQIQFTFLAG